jgi:GNAT superfamily N-acetyltransferase
MSTFESPNITALTRDTFPAFVSLIRALAEYEKLDPPSEEAIERLRRDAFSVLPRFWAWIASIESVAVGYAIAFETYSSFLAKPTMYLEDIFVLEAHRGSGAGSALFDTVRKYAENRDCGRMEWMVLDWNKSAQIFYERKGANKMSEWELYRIQL